ncbi:MAG TPA: succinate dehydrogenase, hydrophobic membrane anchor protein [Caulobacteraceae bacterium]|jgi:succinate dehydrogenase / fumarate reductase membrane anchor subunit
MSDLVTPLRRARGLGSAKHGVGHFIGQRVSAVAILLLAPWVLWSGARLAGSDFDGVRRWLAQPLDAALTILLLLAGFYHAQLGVRVIVEDYVDGRIARVALLVLNAFVAAAAAVLAVVCVLSVVLGSGAV